MTRLPPSQSCQSCQSCRVFLAWLICPGLSSELQTLRAEVDEQSNIQLGPSQIVDQLRLVAGSKAADSFDLDQHALLDQQISGVIADDDAVIPNSHALLSFERYGPLLKL